MPEIDPGRTFRGLPLTPEQDAEIRHYLKHKQHAGVPIDERELAAMLADMLAPPQTEDDDGGDADEQRAIAERAAASIDEAMDPIEASEERIAALESEAMKALNR
ncbi:MAG: hypothetical protein V4508_07470 [Pseudomonadota bacterium]